MRKEIPFVLNSRISLLHNILNMYYILYICVLDSKAEYILRVNPELKLAALSTSCIFVNKQTHIDIIHIRKNVYTAATYTRLLICLFQYSDRFTPVLLIVSLAGIKVCSPDGKVSTRDAHTVTPAEKGLSRLCADVVMEKPSCRYACGIFQDGASSPRAQCEKFASLFLQQARPHPTASRYLLRY